MIKAGCRAAVKTRILGLNRSLQQSPFLKPSAIRLMWIGRDSLQRGPA
jgi:hypothetical protein